MTTVIELNRSVVSEWVEGYENGYFSDSLDYARDSVRENVECSHLIYTRDIRELWTDAGEPEPENYGMGETISESIINAVVGLVSDAVYDEGNWCDACDQLREVFANRLDQFWSENHLTMDDDEKDEFRELLHLFSDEEVTDYQNDDKLAFLEVEEAHEKLIQVYELTISVK